MQVTVSSSVGYVDITEEAVKIRFASVYPFPPCDENLYEKLKEIDERLVDPLWRLNNLYYIIDKKGRLVRFRLKPYQLQLLLNLHNRNIILKARQLGFTTEICIIILDLIIFNSYKQCGIVAHTQPDAKAIFKKIKFAWEHFPEDIKQLLNLSVVGDSKSELELSNGSACRVATSLRSGTYSFVLVTEFGKTSIAFPEKAEEIVTGTFPTVEQGVLVIESTAEGEEGRFYDLCQTSLEVSKRNLPLTRKDFRFFFFPWFESDEYQMSITSPVEIDQKTDEYFKKLESEHHIFLKNEQKLWYYQEQQVQKDKMKREFPSTPEEAFMTSGNKLFAHEAIERAKDFVVKEPLMTTPFGLKLFRYYTKGHVYAIGADISQGIGRDSSTAVVIDFTNGEVVATYKNEAINPVDFAGVLAQIGHLFGSCLIAPESNNVGLTTCNELNSIYPRVYRQMRIGYAESVATEKLGWLSTPSSKPKALYEFAQAVTDTELKVLDEEILNEARMFDREDSLDTSVSATKSSTRHFDLLTAASICWQMRAQASRTNELREQKKFLSERREVRRERRTFMYR